MKTTRNGEVELEAWEIALLRHLSYSLKEIEDLQRGQVTLLPQVERQLNSELSRWFKWGFEAGRGI